MAIIDHLNWRYATKAFDKDKRLNTEQINVLKEAFNLTATSYGLQTLKLVIVEDAKKREELLPFAYGQKQVTDASHLLVICIQNQIDDKDVEVHFENIIKTRNTPEEVLAPFRSQLTDTISSMSLESKEAWAKNQAYIALGNLMTVCAIERIDSCPMEGFMPEQFDNIIGLDALNLKSVLLLPVGFRSENDFFANLKKVRKPLDQTIIEL